MENNNKGANFLDKLYRELYKSQEVINAVERSDQNSHSKYDDINIYLDRIMSIHDSATTEHKKDLLLSLYYKKYVIKKSDITHNIVDKNSIIEQQKKSLASWINYLCDENSKYKTWSKYWAFQGMIRMGSFNAEKGLYNKRNNKTQSPFVECNPEIIAKCISAVEDFVENNKLSFDDDTLNSIIESGSFNKLYSYFENQIKKSISNNDSKKGKWVKYNEKSEGDAIKLSESLQNKNTHWCTADRNTAIDQVCGGNNYPGGDFYVYYTKDEQGNYTNPRIAIRMEGKKEIAEIRGIEDNQNLEDCMLDVLNIKLDEFDFLSKEDYDSNITKIKNLKRLIEISKKSINNITLTEDDIYFIYEIDKPIEGFGWESDEKIYKIRDQRAKKGYKDLTNIPNLELIITKNIGYIKYVDKSNSEYEKLVRIVLDNSRSQYYIKYIDDTFEKYDELVLEYIDKYPSIVLGINENHPNYFNYIYKAILVNYDILKSISIDYPRYYELVNSLIKAEASLISKIPFEYEKYEELATMAINNDFHALRFINPKVNNYYEIAKTAIINDTNFRTLRFTDKNVENYESLCRLAIKLHPEAIIYVDENLPYYEELKAQSDLLLQEINNRNKYNR